MTAKPKKVISVVGLVFSGVLLYGVFNNILGNQGPGVAGYVRQNNRDKAAILLVLSLATAAPCAHCLTEPTEKGGN